MLDTATSETKTALNEEKIRELFERLEERLINNNPECVTLLDDIQRIPGSEELAKQIEDFEFEQALTALQELKARREGPRS